MQKYIASVIGFVCLLLRLASTWSHASDGINLSAADEQAYQSAQAAWERLAKVHEDAGIPPPGEPPQREDFIDYSARLADAAAWDTATRIIAEARWQQRLGEIQSLVRKVIPVGEKRTDDRHTQLVKEEQERLRAFADRAWANRDKVVADLDAIALRHGVSRLRERHDGKMEQLVGEYEGYPVWITSHNQIAAAGISADELWPTNSAPWPSSSTGRDLTGSNIVLGIWEVDGIVNTNHAEFGSRVLQMDNDSTNVSKHATGVAGTMAAHGNHISLPSIPSGSIARGVAFDAFVDAYTTDSFKSELASASLDMTNSPGLRISNHSYGIPSAWAYEFIDTFWYDGNQYSYNDLGVVWRQHPAFYEDPTCGMYFPDMDDGTGSAELDVFLSSNAPRHLLVYSAGNDRFYGPQAPVSYFYRFAKAWHLVFNPPANDKDWRIGDGDTYGFDTVKPPGTSKNVLTVGSVLDVYHDVGGNLQWGFSSNSTVTLSSFSGCGPTDDGRIKPDVVAVGQADPAVRPYGIVTPDDTGGYSTNYWGTSFAAPSVTAGLGLCLQRRSQLFPNLDPSLDAWRSSTLKVLAIHTADDILNPGPDYQSGWGLFSAVSAVKQVELDAQDGRGTHLKELELSVGDTNSWLVDLDGSPFTITIAWNDPPGIPTGYHDDPTPMLVNNIDLWVETEDGMEIFRPWVLDPDLLNQSESNRNANATTGIDNRNNVEQVFIANPTAGRYRIVVAHAGGTAGGQSPSDQWVSIATSGDTPLSPSVVHYELTPTIGVSLLTVTCDPGAYLLLESTTNLLSGVWQTDGAFTTMGKTNMVFVDSSEEMRFWRIRRATGE